MHGSCQSGLLKCVSRYSSGWTPLLHIGDESERIVKKAVVAYSRHLSRRLAGSAEIKRVKRQSGWPLYWPSLEPMTHNTSKKPSWWVGPVLYCMYLRYVWRPTVWPAKHVLRGWILTRSSHLNRDRFLFAMKYFVLYTCVYIVCDNPQQFLFYVPPRLSSCFACPWT